MAKDKERTDLVVQEGTRAVSPFEEMERWMDSFFRNPFGFALTAPWWRESGAAGEMMPHVDIFEDKGDMVVKAELPGVDKEDVNVSITDGVLTISGEKRAEEKVEKKDYHRIERRYGSFCRSFRLPENVNTDKAKAKFKNGVLEIRLPRTKEGKQKKIEIS